MKSVPKQLLKGSIFTIYLLLLHLASLGQGRVVVNEFMAWSAGGGSCPANSEFIELLNFGPGPMNIGCYVVTNGKFSVTIPPNTVLKPGQFYVLAGTDVLAKGCANIDSTIRVDLNWNTCGCATPPQPLSSDGFLQDGGNANEKIVLLDPSLKVVDAVSRNLTPSASDLLTISSVGGQCAPGTFDLDNMGVAYESIGEAQGIGNSYSRKVDGDCGWVKTPSISAKAPNKTSSTSSATYNFTTVSALECDYLAGVVSIKVEAPDVNALFPMSYTLGYDRDSNGVFDNTDTYIHGVDNSAPSIDITNLAYGRYRITVASAMGCNLKSYEFFIFNCYGVVLPLKLHSFTYEGMKGGQNVFAARFADAEGLGSLQLEGAGSDGIFHTLTSRHVPAASTEKNFVLATPPAPFRRYRLKMVEQNGRFSYSKEITVTPPPVTDPRPWPNPVTDRLFLSLSSVQAGTLRYSVLGAGGELVLRGDLRVPSGSSTISLPVQSLLPGLYLLRLEGPSLAQLLTARFAK